MLTTFVHLPKKQLTQLAQLVQGIVKAFNPDKIICFGHRRSVTKDWSCFLENDGSIRNVSPTYDLLIITNEDESRDDHVIIQKIEQQADELDCEVTSIVHKLSSVNELLEKGSRFFGTVYRKGVLLYNGSSIPLTEPCKEPEFSVLKTKIEQAWEKPFEIAKRFYKSANDCLDSGWPEQAMFNLHQTVQHSCMAVLRVFTGYRSTTHNLYRLLALIENFTFNLIIVFPCVTKEEKELFNLLNRAYSDARYNECYIVPPDNAIILKNRVSSFLKIAEDLYKVSLITLENNQPISFPLIITAP